MIVLLWLIGYLVFGFVVIGFLCARESNEDSLSLGGYVIMSVTWPIFLVVWLYYTAEEVHDVVPFLRKVFGGPRE